MEASKGDTKKTSNEKLPPDVQPVKPPANRKPTTSFLKHHPLGQNRFERAQAQSKANLMLKEDHSIDLSQLSLENLKSRLETQTKLIANKKLLSKLPDKGAKAIEFCDSIRKRIEYLESIEMLEKMTINDETAGESKTHTRKLLERIEEKHGEGQCSPRYNQSKTAETIVQVPTSSKSNKYRSFTLKTPENHEIKRLDLNESLKVLQETHEREKQLLETNPLAAKESNTQENHEEEEEEQQQFDEDELNDDCVVSATIYDHVQL